MQHISQALYRYYKHFRPWHPSPPPPQGSIEYALLRLEEYRQRLKSHIIERYDAAVVAGALSGMAQAARIMAEFERGEDICVQVRTQLAVSTDPLLPPMQYLDRNPVMNWAIKP